MSNDPMKIQLKNVRLSFPTLWKPEPFAEGQDPRYSATFILNKKDHADDITRIKQAIRALCKAHLKGVVPPSDKLALQDGSRKADFDGFGSEVVYVQTNARQSRRLVIVGQRKEPLQESDGKPYAGCYVNAYVSFWAMNNQWGKRINCELLGVQFVRDGDSFSAGPSFDADEFDEEEVADTESPWDGANSGQAEDDDILL